MIASFKTKYREYAEAHGKATLSGNYRTANRCHDKLIALLQKIRACGHAGEAVLLELTEDSDDAVRCWAATHTLCFNESRALVTLEKLSRKPGLIGFDAQMVIEQWKKATNMPIVKISYDFVCQRVNLSWRDVKFALGHQFVKPQFAIDKGMERLCTSDDVSSDEIELAGCTGSDSILELVNRLADADQTASDEVEAKWFYLVLAWLFENRETMNDPLGIVEELYSDFGYPHEISSFVRYMPMVGPALENREQNEARLYEYWKRYLDEAGKHFALTP